MFTVNRCKSIVDDVLQKCGSEAMQQLFSSKRCPCFLSLDLFILFIFDKQEFISTFFECC
jgi:hypothetical protein